MCKVEGQSVETVGQLRIEGQWESKESQLEEVVVAHQENNIPNEREDRMTKKIQMEAAGQNEEGILTVAEVKQVGALFRERNRLAEVVQ